MVGEVTYREPEFDAGQRALLLAHARLPAPPSHGVPLEVATDPDNQFRFDVEGPTVDWAANTLGSVQDAFYKKYPGTNRAGHLWTVRLNPDKRIPGS